MWPLQEEPARLETDSFGPSQWDLELHGRVSVFRAPDADLLRDTVAECRLPRRCDR
jgi:hypothetical protein